MHIKRMSLKVNVVTPLLISLLCIACSSTLVQESSHSSDYQGKTARIDTLFSELFKEGKFHGNVLIAEKGQIIYQQAFGLANEATRTPLNLDTRFELASVSKQFTAMGIVQLVKEGKLNYADLISLYIPELTSYGEITIQHLLIHTSGLPDYMGLAEAHWNPEQIATNDDMIRLLEAHKPAALFPPNAQYRYSNTGYLLLGTIIERVSGMPFGEYLQQVIFSPLDMENTFIYRRRYAPQALENYTEGYVWNPDAGQLMLPDSVSSQNYVVYLDGIVGDGMVSSNVADLLKWDRALYGEELVNEAEKSLIFRNYVTMDSSATDYGYGWDVSQTKAYGKIVGHSGGWAGYLTYLERHLDHDKTIIILQNHRTRDIELPIKNTRRILYDLPVENPITLKAEALEALTGTYLTTDGKERVISTSDGNLYYPLGPEDKAKLIPVSPTKFLMEGFRPEVSFTFELDKTGAVLGCRVEQPEQGVDRYMKRRAD